MTRQSSGNSARAITGGVCVSGPRPPSTTSPPVTTYLQVIRNEWRASDAGYTCGLFSAPALPPTERVLPDLVTPPTDGALAIAADSGPWTWGPAGHPLVWDWTQWT